MDENKFEQISEEVLGGIEASGGNWVQEGRYKYKIIRAKGKICDDYVTGPNDFKGVVSSRTCTSCKHLMKMKGFWVCAASKARV